MSNTFRQKSSSVWIYAWRLKITLLIVDDQYTSHKQEDITKFVNISMFIHIFRKHFFFFSKKQFQFQWKKKILMDFIFKCSNWWLTGLHGLPAMQFCSSNLILFHKATSEYNFFHLYWFWLKTQQKYFV